MKKTMKRIMSAAVAMLVIMTMVTVAFAEDSENSLINKIFLPVEEPAEEPAEEEPEAVEEEPAEEPEAVEEEPAEEPEAVEEESAEEPDVVEEEPAEEPEAVEEEPAEEEPAEEEPAEEEADEEEPAEINIRLEADGLSEIILTVSSLDNAEIIAIEGDWVKVVIDETEGYVHISNVPELNGEETGEFKVTVFSSRKSFMTAGETVYLTSLIEGFEGYEVRYQWEVDMGEGYVEIEGANEDSYSFEASAETLAYNWRLIVYYR